MKTIDPTPRLERFGSYEQAYREFRWRIPESFNIAESICHRHSDYATRPAFIELKEAASSTYTFGAIDYLSNKFANVLVGCGITRGDFVAVILSASAALPVAHLAALKIGAVAVPLSVSVDEATLLICFDGCSPKAIIIDGSIRNAIDESVSRLANLEAVFVAYDELLQDSPPSGDKNFWREAYRAASDFSAVETRADSPAFVFHSTGSEAVVHSHSCLIGQLTAFEMCNNFHLGEGVVFLASAEWATSMVLLGLLYPAWFYGRPVIARSSSSQIALVDVLPQLSINEAFGTPETNLIVSNCERWFPRRPGSAGRAAPGHTLAIVDNNGNILSAGEAGRLALKRPDPALFLHYLNDAVRSDRAFSDDWFVTNEEAFMDADGYVWLSRTDD